MKIYTLILSAILLSACSQKNETYANLKAQTLMHTQKQKLSKGQLNGIVSLSYLNPILDQISENEIFVLALAPKDFHQEELEIFINDQKAQISMLTKEDDLMKYLIQNEYANYYKIVIPSQKSATLKAKICLQTLPCFELNFQKYSKSLYYRSTELDTQYN